MDVLLGGDNRGEVREVRAIPSRRIPSEQVLEESGPRLADELGGSETISIVPNTEDLVRDTLLLNHIVEEFGVSLTILHPLASSFLLPKVLLHSSGYGQPSITVGKPFPKEGRRVRIASSLFPLDIFLSLNDIVKDVPKNISIPQFEVTFETLKFGK